MTLSQKSNLIGALFLATLSLAFLVSSLHRGEGEIFAEEELSIRVSDPLVNEVDYSDLAQNDSGDGVVTWQQRAEGWNIYAQRIGKTHEKIGDIIKVNQYSVPDQQFPKAAMNKNGDFVVVWQSYFPWGSGTEILGQKFYANGSKWGSEFKANAIRIKNQILPDVVLEDSGALAVVWSCENYDDNDRKNIYLRRFDPKGEPIQKYETKVSPLRTKLATNPAVDLNAKGQLFIVWQEYLNHTWDIYGQLIGKDHSMLKNPLRINDDEELDQVHPDVAHTETGDFTVVWSNESFHPVYKAIKRNIMGQTVNTSGLKKGRSFQVSEGVFNHNNYPSISTKNGKTIVVWQSFKKGGWKIQGQYLDNLNRPQGGVIDITLNETEAPKIDGSAKSPEPGEYPDLQWNIHPQSKMDSEGCLALTWTSMDLSSNKSSILYKHLYTPFCRPIGEFKWMYQ